jgi:hypothetical protein
MMATSHERKGTDMKKTISFVASGERCSVTVETQPAQQRASGLTIDLKPIPADAFELSITGESSGSAGQCTDSIRAAGAGNADVAHLCDIWERWHLNGLKAGTRAQQHGLAQLDPQPREYEARKASLAEMGLDPDRNTAPDRPPYSYGSAWLFEPVPVAVMEELTAILDRLDGARIGSAPAVDDAPELGSDVIDSRNVIARTEIYRAAVEEMGVDPETVDSDLDFDGVENLDADQLEIVEEFAKLKALDEAGADSASDWRYGATLIRDSYFEDYARELADDIGAVDGDARHGRITCIDWELAASQLQADYTSIEFDGETYWVR